MKTIATIKALVRKLFAAEMSVSDTLGHDPFKGHDYDSKQDGKSYFDDSLSEYVGWQPGEICDAGDGEPQDFGLREINSWTSGDVTIFIFEAYPTKMVEESMGTGVIRDALVSESWRQVPIGMSVTTKCPRGEMIVKSIHGCLQITAPKESLEFSEEETAKVTVVLTKESTGWAVASVYPGEPGGDIGKWLANASHDAGDPDNLVTGYKDGDVFDPDHLVREPEPWIFEHIVGV